MTVGLEVHTNIKLLGCVMKVLHSSFSTPDYYLNHMKMCEHYLKPIKKKDIKEMLVSHLHCVFQIAR